MNVGASADSADTARDQNDLEGNSSWGDGLTAEERRDAKRRIKNKRGRQRWRQRKQEQRLAPTPTLGLTDAAAGLSWFSEDSKEQMLHEFKRLGKAQEAVVKEASDRLISFSVLPDGYNRYKLQVFDLCERIAQTATTGAPSIQENAQRMMALTQAPLGEWESFEGLTAFEALKAYADGTANTVFVDISLPNTAEGITITLTQLACMDKAVLLELYLRNLDHVRQNLPAAFLKGSAETIKLAMTEHAGKAHVLGIALVVSQAFMHLMLKLRGKHLPPGRVELEYAWRTLAISQGRVDELKNLWQKAHGEAFELLQDIEILEKDLHQQLSTHALQNEDMRFQVFCTARTLRVVYEEVVAIFMRRDFSICYDVLSPYETAVLAAVQMPKLPLDRVLAEGVDPFLRPGHIADVGII